MDAEGCRKRERRSIDWKSSGGSVVRVRGWCYFKLSASHCLQLAYKGNREIVIIKIDKKEEKQSLKLMKRVDR